MAREREAGVADGGSDGGWGSDDRLDTIFRVQSGVWGMDERKGTLYSKNRL